MEISKTITFGPVGFGLLTATGRSVESFGKHVLNLSLKPGDIVAVTLYGSQGAPAVLAMVGEINHGEVTFTRFPEANVEGNLTSSSHHPS